MSRLLSVDPGEVRIGLAISDETQTISRPLEVLWHCSREKDAQRILQIAKAQGAQTIVVGLALDINGEVGQQARRALRLVEALERLGSIPVVTWDESGSTEAARRGKKDDKLLDARAAAYILQEYLDARKK